MKFKLEPFLAAGFVFGILALPNGAVIPLTWKCFNAVWRVSKALFNLADLTEKAENQDRLQQYSKVFLNRLRNIQSIVEKDSPRLGCSIRTLTVNGGSLFEKTLNELDEKTDLRDAQALTTKINQLVEVLGEECQQNLRLREEVNALREELNNFVSWHKQHEKSGASNEGGLLGAIFDLSKALADLESAFEEVPVVSSGEGNRFSNPLMGLLEEPQENQESERPFFCTPIKLDVPAPNLSPRNIQAQGNG